MRGGEWSVVVEYCSESCALFGAGGPRARRCWGRTRKCEVKVSGARGRNPAASRGHPGRAPRRLNTTSATGQRVPKRPGSPATDDTEPLVRVSVALSVSSSCPRPPCATLVGDVSSCPHCPRSYENHVTSTHTRGPSINSTPCLLHHTFTFCLYRVSVEEIVLKCWQTIGSSPITKTDPDVWLAVGWIGVWVSAEVVFEWVVVVLISKLYHLKSEFCHNNEDIIRLKQ